MRQPGLDQTEGAAKVNSWKEKQDGQLRSRVKVLWLTWFFECGSQTSNASIPWEPVRNEHPRVSRKHQKLWAWSPAMRIEQVLQVLLRHAQV